MRKVFLHHICLYTKCIPVYKYDFCFFGLSVSMFYIVSWIAFLLKERESDNRARHLAWDSGYSIFFRKRDLSILSSAFHFLTTCCHNTWTSDICISVSSIGFSQPWDPEVTSLLSEKLLLCWCRNTSHGCVRHRASSPAWWCPDNCGLCSLGFGLKARAASCWPLTGLLVFYFLAVILKVSTICGFNAGDRKSTHGFYTTVRCHCSLWMEIKEFKYFLIFLLSTLTAEKIRTICNFNFGLICSFRPYINVFTVFFFFFSKLCAYIAKLLSILAANMHDPLPVWKNSLHWMWTFSTCVSIPLFGTLWEKENLALLCSWGSNCF